MDTQEKIVDDFVRNGYKTYLPHVSIDCAIFGYHDHEIKILLAKIEELKGYCLPGGYIRRTETLDEAATRILYERTLISGLYLHQYKTFGDPDRIKWNSFDINALEKFPGYGFIKKSWLMDQTISIGYYAITDFSLVQPQPGLLTSSCEWFDLDKIPDLLFDHDNMVRDSLQTLRQQLYYLPIAEKLLPKKFTLTEIHSLYETILGRNLDIRNFPKKLIFLGLINRLKEKRNIGPHRAPFLYSFNHKQYNRALEKGITLV